MRKTERHTGQMGWEIDRKADGHEEMCSWSCLKYKL